MGEAETRIAGIIGSRRKGREKLIATLEESETLDAAEIEACLGRARPRAGPKKFTDAG